MSTRFRPVVLMAAIGIAACGDCNREDENSPTPTETTVTPVAAPEGLVAIGSLGGGKSTLDRFRRELPGVMPRLLLPTDPSALLAGIASFPDSLRDRIDEDADVHFAVHENESHYAVAARIRLDSEAAPLGDGVSLTPAEFGGQWIGTGRPGPATTDNQPGAAALFDRVLIVAPNRSSIEILGPYLASRTVNHQAPSGLHATIVEGVAGDSVRRRLTTLLDGQLAHWREQAAQERARHDEPPAFADPESILAVLDEFLHRWLAFLPDVGEVELRARPEPGLISFTLDGDIRADSPLAEILAERPTTSAELLLAVAQSTAFAIAGAPPGSSSDPLASLFRIAGDRIEPTDQELLRQAYGNLRAGLSNQSLLVVASDANGAALAIATREAEGLPGPDPLDAALRREYMAGLLSAIADCPGNPRGGRFQPSANQARLWRPLCPSDEASPKLALTRAEREWSLALLPGGDPGLSIDEDLVAALQGQGAHLMTLENDPDLARLIRDSGPSSTLLAGVARPAHLMRLIALTRRSALPVPDYRTPALWIVERRDGGARVSVHLTNRALEELFTVLRPLAL